MANKKKKKEFGWFYSMSPNAGNVEYNNKVFNSMMMPGGGETSQGDSQAVAEDLDKDNTMTIRRKIRYNELPGRDYFSKVKGLAQDIISYLKKNPESTYDFILINDEGFKVDPKEFYNDLVDFLRAEDPDKYSITATLRPVKGEPTMFDYNYSVYDDQARYGELREAQEKALPVKEAIFISKPQRYKDLDTFKAKLIMNPMTGPEKYRVKSSYATDIKSFDDLDRVVKETHFVGGQGTEDRVINALEILSSDGTYLVNPSGYDYARYVAFIPKEIKEDMKENLREDTDIEEFEDDDLYLEPIDWLDDSKEIAESIMRGDVEDLNEDDYEVGDALTLIAACDFLEKDLHDVVEMSYSEECDYFRLTFKDSSTNDFYNRGISGQGIKDVKTGVVLTAYLDDYLDESLKQKSTSKRLKESIDEYKITSMEDMLDDMSGNTDDETIDTTLKVFRKVSSHLGTHKKDIVVLVTDPTTEYDPKNSDIKFEVEGIPHRFKQSSLHTYKTPDYEFIREQVYPANMVFLYFKNEGDKDQYLNDVYGVGGVQEDLSPEDYATKADDIEFIMHDYVENDLSVSKLIQKDKLTYIVELEDGRKPEIKFDDQWDEWVYSIDGSDPISHSSYEYLISDLDRYAKENLKEDTSTYQIKLKDYFGGKVHYETPIRNDHVSCVRDMISIYNEHADELNNAYIAYYVDGKFSNDISGSVGPWVRHFGKKYVDDGHIQEEGLKEASDEYKEDIYWQAYYWDINNKLHKIAFKYDTADWDEAEEELDARISEPYVKSRLLGRVINFRDGQDGFKLVEALKESVEEDKPFTYREVYDELKREGELKNPSGKIHYGFKSEAEMAHKILSRKHKNCEIKDLPDGNWEISWDDEKLEESLNDKADTDIQRSVIKVIENIANELGIKLHYGTKVGKIPQTIVLDYEPQDNAVSINPDGSLEIGEVELDKKAKKQDIAQALHSLLELNEKLIQSDSDKALQKNIKTEIKAGKDPKQAAAIAYSVQEKNKKKEEGYVQNTWNNVLVEEVDDNPVENYLDF